MVTCKFCELDMLTVDDCPANRTITTFEDGIDRAAIPYSWEVDGVRCHDCNVMNGGYHHPGCDMEVCPKCGGQLISCGCLKDEENESGANSFAEKVRSMDRINHVIHVTKIVANARMSGLDITSDQRIISAIVADALIDALPPDMITIHDRGRFWVYLSTMIESALMVQDALNKE